MDFLLQLLSLVKAYVPSQVGGVVDKCMQVHTSLSLSLSSSSSLFALN